MPATCSAPLTEQRFAETAWSVVLAAGHLSQPDGREALAELCRTYWPAVYGFLRRRGYNRDDAQDLTQSFFQQMLADDTVRRASPTRGRFRNFLLGALTRALADEQARLRTLKRGGQFQFISMDQFRAEEMGQQWVANDVSPSDSVDARWARIILERALEKVRIAFFAGGNGENFEALSPFLMGDKPDISYAEVAERTKLSLGAVKTQIHRLRRQFASAVRQEVMRTVSAPHEVDDELRHLRGVFARPRQQQTF